MRRIYYVSVDKFLLFLSHCGTNCLSMQLTKPVVLSLSRTVTKGHNTPAIKSTQCITTTRRAVFRIIVEVSSMIF